MKKFNRLGENRSIQLAGRKRAATKMRKLINSLNVSEDDKTALHDCFNGYVLSCK